MASAMFRGRGKEAQAGVRSSGKRGEMNPKVRGKGEEPSACDLKARRGLLFCMWKALGDPMSPKVWSLNHCTAHSPANRDGGAAVQALSNSHAVEVWECQAMGQPGSLPDGATDR
jgi:hypothetical protein